MTALEDEDGRSCYACGRQIPDGELCVLCWLREDGAYRTEGGEA